MAQTRIKLARALRHDGARYLPGEEQALLDVLSKQQVKDYLAKGHLVEVEPEGVELGGEDAGELEALRTQLATATEERDELKRQNSTLKGQLTRLKNQSDEDSEDSDAGSSPA